MRIILTLILYFTGTALSWSQVLFNEQFEDTNFVSRGWYDNTSNALLSTTEHCPGSLSSIQYSWNTGQIVPNTGGEMRMLFTPSSEIYVSYWVKYSDNYIGSGVAYHPHEIYLLTDADNMWIGPGGTHLTAYIEHNAGYPRLALQDLLNVDTNCILQNNNNFIGCNGDFNTYTFSESRSVCSCNGLAGPVDGRDCYLAASNPSQWYSARFWRNTSVTLLDSNWHQLQVRFKMNSIVGGIGQVDGIMQYWLDGNLILDYDSILYRTGVNANMKFNQLLIGPYIGVGSPVTQSFWIDELTVSTLPIITWNRELDNQPSLIRVGQEGSRNIYVDISGNTHQTMLYIFDLSGRIIFRENFGNGMHLIGLQGASSGLYFIEAINDERSETKRFYFLE